MLANIRCSSRRIGAFTLMVACLSVHGQTKSDPEYVAGYTAWTGQAYREASDHLSRYRVSVAYGKAFDVDYLLGTSWCRLEGFVQQGTSLLDWAMQQDLPPAAAKQFRTELAFCLSRLRNPSTGIALPLQLAKSNTGASASAGATAAAQGKLFYVGGGEKGSVAAYPLELVAPLTEEQYEARIFPLTAADEAIAAVSARLPSFRVVGHGHFVLASTVHSQADLDTIGQKLEHFAAFLQRRYGARLPDKFITVQLVATSHDLVGMARKVHGLKASESTLGYTFQNDLSISGAVATTAIGTLLHELTHLAVRANFGDIPSWLDESLASLYETSTASGDDYFGQPNWRGPILKASGLGRFSLAELVASMSADQIGNESGEQRLLQRPDQMAAQAALGRYLAMYLQQKGKLGAVYDAFHNKPDWVVSMRAADASLRLVSEAAGQPLPELERDFEGWLRMATQSANLRFPVPGSGVDVPRELPQPQPSEVDPAMKNSVGNSPMRQSQ